MKAKLYDTDNRIIMKVNSDQHGAVQGHKNSNHSLVDWIRFLRKIKCVGMAHQSSGRHENMKVKRQ